MSTEGLERVGLGNRTALNSKQIYQDVSDDEEETIGMDQGRDWEDEVDREIVRESPRPQLSLPPLPGPGSRALQFPAPPKPVVQAPRGEKRKKKGEAARGHITIERCLHRRLRRRGCEDAFNPKTSLSTSSKDRG